MYIKDLIKELEKYDDDDLVTIDRENFGDSDCVTVTTVRGSIFGQEIFIS